MGATLLAYPDRTLSPATALSGGSWQGGFPLANLQNDLISKPARSTDCLAASTRIVVDLGAAYDIRLLALLNHNLTLAATVQVRGYSDAGLTALEYDTGSQYVWPQSLSEEDTGVWPNNWIFPLPAVGNARYALVEIFDEDNPEGFVSIGRCWIGPAFEPEDGVVFGVSLGYESGDAVTFIRGVPWGERREQRRKTLIRFGNLTTEEKRTALIMQKTFGKLGEMLYVMNRLAAAEDIMLESFPALISQADPLAYPYFNVHELPMELIEKL